MVAELLYIELVPYTRAERDDERVELVIAVDLVCARLLDVQHFAPHGENCLEAAVTSLNGGACGAVALDDVDFAQGGVALVAVLELVRHLPGLKPGLAPDGFLCFSRRLARAVCHHGLFEDDLRGLRMLLKIGGKLVADHLVNESSYIGVAELLLGLSLKLCLRQLYGDNGGDTLAHILAGDLVVALDDVGFLAVGVYDPCQRRLEARLVHTALRGVDIVCKGLDVFVIAVVILQGYLGNGVALCCIHIDNVVMDGVLILVEVAHILPDAALVEQNVALLSALALV